MPKNQYKQPFSISYFGFPTPKTVTMLIKENISVKGFIWIKPVHVFGFANHFQFKGLLELGVRFKIVPANLIPHFRH